MLDLYLALMEGISKSKCWYSLTEGPGESINSVSKELNAEVNVQEECVTDGLQVDNSLIARLKEKLLHHKYLIFPSDSVLVQKLNNDSSETAITDKEKEAPRITEVNAGEFHFNANCINSKKKKKSLSILFSLTTQYNISKYNIFLERV